ncbi:hypothetical protein J3R30DRAFT_2276680 [Lentinula aciculospora]|uniref:Protein kinase domain-containing protein n=1 Tax=Lentinula aciculospora TaxID=153920 RepID=A0A9W9DED2_9AGAR|nr:hypothetical protein J3R30DRAFT_2276680 [Lentinula aciculospora]
MRLANVSLVTFPSMFLKLPWAHISFLLAATCPSDRIDAPVRYLLIDLGSSTKFDERRLVKFRHGWHKNIPEIYEIDAQGKRVPTRLYDPFKGDVFLLGMVLEGYFGKSIPLLRSLFAHMQNPSPIHRPTASEALNVFHQYAKPLYASRRNLIMPVTNPSPLDDVDAAELEFFARGMVWIVATLWGWVDYLRLVCKVLWKGQELRIGV